MVNTHENNYSVMPVTNAVPRMIQNSGGRFESNKTDKMKLSEAPVVDSIPARCWVLYSGACFRNSRD